MANQNFIVASQTQSIFNSDVHHASTCILFGISDTMGFKVLDRVLRNSNVTHNVILQVKEPGRYNISWARLSYTTDDGQEQVWLNNHVFLITLKVVCISREVLLTS